VIDQHLLHAAFLLRLLLQRIETLHDEITNRVAGLEFEEPRSVEVEVRTLV
jgi:hypothetical protein